MKIEYRKVNIWDIKVLSPISERKQRGERNVQSFKKQKIYLWTTNYSVSYLQSKKLTF